MKDLYRFLEIAVTVAGACFFFQTCMTACTAKELRDLEGERLRLEHKKCVCINPE